MMICQVRTNVGERSGSAHTFDALGKWNDILASLACWSTSHDDRMTMRLYSQDDDSMTMFLWSSQDDNMTMCMSNSQDDDSMTMCVCQIQSHDSESRAVQPPV